MSEDNEQLSKKIQVLLSVDDYSGINNLLLRRALDKNKRPIPISAYVRELIQEDLNKNQPEQSRLAGNQ